MVCWYLSILLTCWIQNARLELDKRNTATKPGSCCGSLCNKSKQLANCYMDMYTLRRVNRTDLIASVKFKTIYGPCNVCMLMPPISLQHLGCCHFGVKTPKNNFFNADNKLVANGGLVRWFMKETRASIKCFLIYFASITQQNRN